MKKFAALMLAFLMLMSGIVCLPAAPLQAQDNPYTIRVFLDNNQLRFDEEPFIRDNRTLVPLRGIFEGLGSQVSWNDTTQTITAFYGKTELRFQIDNTTYYVGGQPKVADVAPQLVRSRTFVPLRLVAECYNAKVYWNEDAQAVFIYSEKYQVPDNILEETEPNNTKDQANSIVLGQTIRPHFGVTGDIDYFKLWVNKPGLVKIITTPGNAQMDPVFKIYSEKGSDPLAISSKDVQGIENVVISLDPGIYYIVCTNSNGQSNLDTYTLTTTSVQ